MEDILPNLYRHFPSLPQNALKTIYRMRVKRMRLLMINRMPVDIHWMIEASVCLFGVLVDSYIPYMPGLGKNIYA